MDINHPRHDSPHRHKGKVAIPTLKRLEATNLAPKSSVRPTKAVSTAKRDALERSHNAKAVSSRTWNAGMTRSAEIVSESSALERNHMLTELLKDSPVHDDQEKREKVEEVLKTIANAPFSTMPNAVHASVKVFGKRCRRDFSSAEDDHADDNGTLSKRAPVVASASCLQGLNFLEDNVLHDDQVNSTGLLGRESPVHWLQFLYKRTEQYSLRKRTETNSSTVVLMTDSDDSIDNPPFLSRGTIKSVQFAEFNFYLDASDINVDIGDPNIVPCADTAGRLYEHYRSVVHDPFRVLGDAFAGQLRRYYIALKGDAMLSVCSKWKACMNLVFAIGARYAQLIDDDPQAEDHNHLAYMWRAVHLLELGSFSAPVLAPDLSFVQTEAYTSEWEKAWYTLGISIRHAQAAGLHLRHQDPSLSLERKTTLSQTWWALHSIETLLTSVTGQPRVISLRDITAILPRALSGAEKRPLDANTRPSHLFTRIDSSPTEPSEPPSRPSVVDSRASFLNGYIGIDLVMHKVLTTLYSPRTSNISWMQTQKQIATLLPELEEWALQSLPHGLLASTALTNRREHFSLYLYYGSAKMYITRPCLCRIDMHNESQSEGMTGLDKKTAEICVQSALNLCSKFSEEPNLQWLYSRGPWWSIVHIIMQTVAILLLELSHDSIHATVGRPNVIASIDKLTRWLRCMKVKDAVSERAYNIVCRLRKTVEILPGQESQGSNHSASPSFSNVPTQPLLATTYAPLNVCMSSTVPQPQQPLPDLQTDPTAFQHSNYPNPDRDAQGNLHPQPQVQHLVALQDASAPFSQDHASESLGDPGSNDFNRYVGWENAELEDWMA
ncbi:hypothetical protein LEMA_P008470.1 [Plenodomus lingam JN3]|uniref:Xylanolytic transcriptional activator regulatory domain-containing protein n=1 Tax=Leptosphaeria maculans (strain JN3 / isolate v23.1.3 / race Av1-4-5-6-7-8) TaxID=985895 RepID=E5AFS1_LEPMJ|nr:hypothetical protein LEMA_P008470.1 [Plenodomus lingam JN3]CBY02060.1 hypothetical protein LEMA_P008470.1 [Plenodomus lingam JN3]